MPDEIGTLFHTASTPTMSVDPYAVLAGGRRRRRRRALTAVAGTAAAALVLGGGGWALLADRAGDDRTLPAATTSPSPFVPATLEGPTTEVPLGAIPPTGRTVPVVVSVTLDDARSRLGFTLRSEDGTVLAAQTVGESRTERPVWATLVPGVTVAVLPADATSALPLWTGSSTAKGSVQDQAPDGRVVAVWWTDGTAKDPFRNVVWTEGTQVRTGLGETLSSVVGEDLVFFAGGSAGLVGYLALPTDGQALGSGEAKRAEDMAPGTFPAVWAEDPAGSSGTYVTYLPPVEDVELVTTGDARVRDLAVHDFGDVVGLLVVADVEGSRESVTEVRFTDPKFGPTGGPAPAG